MLEHPAERRLRWRRPGRRVPRTGPKRLEALQGLSLRFCATNAVHDTVTYLQVGKTKLGDARRWRGWWPKHDCSLGFFNPWVRRLKVDAPLMQACDRWRHLLTDGPCLIQCRLRTPAFGCGAADAQACGAFTWHAGSHPVDHFVVTRQRLRMLAWVAGSPQRGASCGQRISSGFSSELPERRPTNCTTFTRASRYLHSPDRACFVIKQYHVAGRDFLLRATCADLAASMPLHNSRRRDAWYVTCSWLQSSWDHARGRFAGPAVVGQRSGSSVLQKRVLHSVAVERHPQGRFPPL